MSVDNQLAVQDSRTIECISKWFFYEELTRICMLYLEINGQTLPNQINLFESNAMQSLRH